MLYEIKEVEGKFQLYFRKKAGFKFKKSFPYRRWSGTEWVERRDETRQEIEYFVHRYLRHCCVRCREQGWVYKTRSSGGIYGGGASHGNGSRGLPHHGKPAAGSIVVCPECRSRHELAYEQSIILGLLL